MSPRSLRWLTAGAMAAAVLVPTAVVREGPRLCLFHALTGRSCPSCGMTRSWNAIGHGDLRAAVRYHALGPATFVAAAAVVAGGDGSAARLLEPDARMRPVLAALSAAWVGAWAWRLAAGKD
ncbi:MAG: DUF2752 domain-containing protein [Chloroflexi bacterium]|nr:MAG: DUF2752 domain-containing protein [Chloroflexota bacterium]